MICPRCRIEMIHVEFPNKHYEVLGRNGKPLPEAVDRCPCCSAETPTKRTAIPAAVPEPVEQPEQLSFFVPTVGGLQ